MSNNTWHVLQEHVTGSNLTDDPADVWPEPTVIVSSGALPGCGERLTRETGSDDVHAANPRASVEGAQVRPHRSLIQSRLAHPGHEDGRCVGVPLNVSHGAGGVSKGKLEPAVAGAEVKGM